MYPCPVHSFSCYFILCPTSRVFSPSCYRHPVFPRVRSSLFLILLYYYHSFYSHSCSLLISPASCSSYYRPYFQRPFYCPSLLSYVYRCPDSLFHSYRSSSLPPRHLYLIFYYYLSSLCPVFL